MKIATVCSGIGSPELAVENLSKELGFEYENVFACEIDKFARASYSAIHRCGTMYEDMTKEQWDQPNQYADLFIGGIPCQAFSLAGKRLGEKDKRGVLFYDFYRYVKNQQPKVFIIENVKGLLSDAKGRTFKNWCALLGQTVNYAYNLIKHQDCLDYHLHYTVLNTKDFGLPQNRERVFLIGIRPDLGYDFEFPKGWPLTKRLKDVLEKEVDEKYYLSQKMIEAVFTPASEKWKSGKMQIDLEVARTINATVYKMHRADTDNYISDKIEIDGEITPNSQAGKVYSPNGISPAVSAGTHGYALGYVTVHEATKKGFSIAEPGDSINLSNPNSKTRCGRVGKQLANTLDTACNQVVVEPICGAIRGRNPENPKSRVAGEPTQQILEVNDNPYITNVLSTIQKDNVVVEPSVRQLNPSVESGKKQPYKQNRIYDGDAISPVLDTECGRPSYLINSRIRRLTPLETWRLQGFADEAFYKAKEVNSDTQLYKQSGNSISEPVIQAIIRNLLPILNK
ncbi:DNA (cytosine-5-)-methyltransferase [Pedobacter ureilyticus]|uniref:Cytosine-specific methyltransferase n=1 Tax=Pedobacter ureilyticus TaxID=1393051 RepID=A0ABW9J2V7_9SPHI|nr:DNA (cytosine-5-)-methyltransferase [Pedobacter helvus]